MRRTVLLVAVVLVLAGCSSGATKQAANTSGPSLPASTSSSAPTSSAAAAASRTNTNGVALNSRGNIPKAFGQTGGVAGTQGGPLVVTFAVDAIRVDPKCDAPGAATPMNGHYVAVDLRVATDSSLSFPVSFSQQDFSIIGPDGVTDTNVVGYGFTCLRDQFTSNQLGPGQQYRGSMVLDVKETSGSVIFRPAALGADGGWEWQIP